jgi:hypothetical protein
MRTYNVFLSSLGYAMQKLSRLQIIGLVLSFLWILGSIYTQYNSIIESATSLSASSYELCIQDQTRKNQEPNSSCLEQKNKDYKAISDNLLTTIIAVAFLPLPFFWIYAFILLIVFRCFKHGSKTVLDLSSLNKWQKYFAYFCYLWSGMTLLLLILSAMAISAERNVPVNFGFNKKIIHMAEYGYVEIEGTWTNNKKDLYSEPPIQTSLIKCDSKIKKCYESRAQVSMFNNYPYLKANHIEYDITSWNKNTLVFSVDEFCYISIFTLDFNSKSLVGIKKFNNNKFIADSCKSHEKDADIFYRLEDGYVVRQELIRNANPWPLKILQSFF